MDSVLVKYSPRSQNKRNIKEASGGFIYFLFFASPAKKGRYLAIFNSTPTSFIHMHCHRILQCILKCNNVENSCIKLSQINQNRSISVAYIALDCFPILFNFELSEGTAIVEPLGAPLWLLEYLLDNIDKNFNNRYANANNTIDDRQNELKRKLAFTYKKKTKEKVNHTARRICTYRNFLFINFHRFFCFPFL